MKILLIGAGYIGMALLPLLKKQSHEITITTTQEQKIDKLQAYGTVLHLKPDNQHAFQYHIALADVIIVLVAPNPSKTYEETYLKTATELTSAIQNRKRPLYLLYTSSTSVCEGMQGVIKEETILDPKSLNSQILFATEEVYLQANAEVCILRLGGIYGPGRELHKRARFLSNKILAGTGNEPTNNIHQKDVLRAIIHAISNHLTGIYHVVNDDHIARNELYSDLCNKNNLLPPIWDHSLKSNRGAYIVSNEKIKNSGFIFFET